MCKSNAVWFKWGGRYEKAFDFIYLYIKAPMKIIKLHERIYLSFTKEKMQYFFFPQENVFSFSYRGPTFFARQWLFSWNTWHIKAKMLQQLFEEMSDEAAPQQHCEYTAAHTIRSHLAGHLWIIQCSALFAESSFRIKHRLAYQLSKHICHRRHLTHPLCGYSFQRFQRVLVKAI